MAAFIQRLFKNRKTEKSRAPESPRPTPAEDSVKTSHQDENRQQQLEQLKSSPSEETLEILATSGVTAEIRLQAVAALDDHDRLQRVQKQAKGKDKSVFQAARQKLQKIREDENHAQATRETIERLIQHARDQARSEDTKLYQPRLEALQKQWKEVAQQASSEDTSAFLDAVQQCKERLAGIQQREADEKRHQDQREQRKQTLALLTDTLDELKQQDAETEASLSSLDALQKTQETRWQEATRETTVEPQQQKQYEARMQALGHYIAAVRNLGQQREALTSLLDSDEDNPRDAARELLAAIDWPPGFTRPEALQRLEKLAGEKPRPKQEPAQDQEARKRLLSTLEQTLSKLEQALESRQLKESRQLFKTAQSQLRDLGERQGRSLQSRIQLLGGQLRELNDWQGFATEPKQIELCEQMEYLADQPMDPEIKAEKIKELQNEWKTLGGSSDRTLWNRFKQASDTAFEPCKAYFSAKSGLKQVNLDKRAAICDELDTFLTSADWSGMDWKTVEKIHRVAREEWKAAWPVDFRDNRPVQKRFDGLLKQIEKPLNDERERNEAQKQEIVERAEALVSHEPLEEAMNEAKSLQQQWKAIGITRHREDRKLWQAFRTACDAIFARREAQRDEQQAQSRQADEHAQSVLQALPAADSQADEEQLDEALGNLKQIPREQLSPAVRKQVQEVQQTLETQKRQRAADQQIRNWQSLVLNRVEQHLEADAVPKQWPSLAAEAKDLTARDLVIRAEILAGVDSPEADQPLRMEIQVKRLASGMGNNGGSDQVSHNMESLIAGWCLMVPQDQLNPDLATRLNNALATLKKAGA